MNNERYNSAHWRKLRKRLVDNDADAHCHLCKKRVWGRRGGKHFTAHLHHLHYDTVGEETEDDVRVLCPSCHDTYHSIISRAGGEGWLTDLKDIARYYMNCEVDDDSVEKYR